MSVCDANQLVLCSVLLIPVCLHYTTPVPYWLSDPCQSIKNQKDSSLKFLIAKTHQIIKKLLIKFLSFLSTDVVLRRGQITFQRFQILNPGELINARARHKAFTSTKQTIYQMSIYNNGMVGI